MHISMYGIVSGHILKTDQHFIRELHYSLPVCFLTFGHLIRKSLRDSPGDAYGWKRHLMLSLPILQIEGQA